MAKPWSELVELVPELDITLSQLANPRWAGDALRQANAAEWLADRGYYVGKGTEQCTLLEEGDFDDGLVPALGVSAPTYSECLRLAVEAVAGEDSGSEGSG